MGMYPIAHFVVLLLWMAINRLSLRSLFRNPSFLRFVGNKRSFVQHLSSLSAAIAFLLCYWDKIEILWDRTENGMYRVQLEMGWETVMIWMGITLGSLMAFRKMDEKKVNLKLLE